MSDTHTILEIAYRGAKALNNMAILMLQRQYNQRALSTFQDALDLMNMVSTLESTGMPQTWDVDRRLRQATECLSNPVVAPAGKGALRELHFSTVLPDDSDCVTAIESSSRIFIRFEEYGAERSSQRDIDLDCSVILQNFGLTYLSLASSTPSGHKLRSNAIKVLQLAQTLIKTRAEEATEEDDLLEKMLFLALVSTKSMAQALMSIGDKAEWHVKACYERLSSLEAAVCHFGFHISSHRDRESASAA